MRNMKHVGQLANTQKRVVVVFRELPDDANSCLVVDTDALPDWMQDNVLNAVESPGSQASTNFYEYAERTVLTDGTNMLQSLHKTGRLMKQPTSNVMMTPNAEVAVKLSEINDIVRAEDKTPVVAPPSDEVMMATKDASTDAMTPAQRRTAINEGTMPAESGATQPVPAMQATADGTLDETAMAKNLLAQAKGFEAEAKSLKQQAYDMVPGLKPGPKKPVSTKATKADTKETAL
jgi:hypothetical protein|tara:strand:- start:55 stop:756 length:702 start_codon:yes stop_codon:yes gene_type:complete